jgi:GTPase SAR1 family protein
MSTRYRAITKAYYKGSIGAMVVFDLTRKITLENTVKWFEELSQHGEPNVVKILIGNKSDLSDERAGTSLYGTQ